MPGGPNPSENFALQEAEVLKSPPNPYRGYRAVFDNTSFPVLLCSIPMLHVTKRKWVTQTVPHLHCDKRRALVQKVFKISTRVLQKHLFLTLPIKKHTEKEENTITTFRLLKNSIVLVCSSSKPLFRA